MFMPMLMMSSANSTSLPTYVNTAFSAINGSNYLKIDYPIDTLPGDLLVVHVCIENNLEIIKKKLQLEWVNWSLDPIKSDWFCSVKTPVEL